MDQHHLQPLARLPARTLRAHDRSQISRIHADARVGHENCEHPTRFVDTPALRHRALCQRVLHSDLPLSVSERLR